jgi:hypothetical protein
MHTVFWLLILLPLFGQTFSTIGAHFIPILASIILKTALEKEPKISIIKTISSDQFNKFKVNSQ